MSLTTAGWIWAGPTAEPLRAFRSPLDSIWTIARNRMRSWDSGILVDLLDLVDGDSPFKAICALRSFSRIGARPASLFPGYCYAQGLPRVKPPELGWVKPPNSRNRRKWPFLAILATLTICGYRDTPGVHRAPQKRRKRARQSPGSPQIGAKKPPR